MKHHVASRTSALILAGEALAVFVLAGFQMVALVQGDVSAVATALALLVLTIIMGGGIAAFAWGAIAERTWARSGGVVTQLLILSIALGAATGTFAHPEVAAVIAAPAVIGLIALFNASKQTARAHEKALREQQLRDEAVQAANERDPQNPA